MDQTFMLNAMILNRMKTDSTMSDVLFTTVALILITYFSNKVKLMSFDHVNWKNCINYFSKKNRVEYEGKLSCRMDRYENRVNHTACFSNSFSALWKFIIDSTKTNPSIYSIKEHNYTIKSMVDDESSIFTVNQFDEFTIDAALGIYALTYIFRESNEEEDANKNTKSSANKTDRIIIELYSIVSNVNTIKEFVDRLTVAYIDNIENLRKNKQFIYSLEKLDFEENSYERWKEISFESTRTFDNLFFENRETVKNKLDYFLQNKAWYYEKGIPYSLGIGIHGPPGTGKTSFIKALANYTHRHIVTISLKMIKTKKQLDGVFFEERYSHDNKKHSVTFDKKIIVFEDIDCVGDIVKNRATKELKTPIISLFDEKDPLAGLIKIPSASMKPIEDPITLDDILNLWDGICETPGRIMILTSNHYDELDPALRRPGRIDVTLEMQNASRQIIAEMHKHLFKQDIDDAVLAQIPDRFYSPAEIINIYVNDPTNNAKFCERLCMGKNV